MTRIQEENFNSFCSNGEGEGLEDMTKKKTKRHEMRIGPVCVYKVIAVYWVVHMLDLLPRLESTRQAGRETVKTMRSYLLSAKHTSISRLSQLGEVFESYAVELIRANCPFWELVMQHKASEKAV